MKTNTSCNYHINVKDIFILYLNFFLIPTSYQFILSSIFLLLFISCTFVFFIVLVYGNIDFLFCLAK